MPADESYSKWSQTEDDEDLEVFVVDADEEQAPPPPPPPLAVDLPRTISDEDVDGDDWKDQSWLASLDDLDEPVASAPAPRPTNGSPTNGSPTNGSPTNGSRPAQGFVDATALPDRPAGGGERLDEVIQTLASAAPDEASARRVADADTAALLRELSLLSVDG